MTASCIKKHLGVSEIFGIIEEKCTKKTITLPDTWKDDFQKYIQLPIPRGITSFSVLQAQICRRIKDILEKDISLGNAYGEIYAQIAIDVRIAIASALGFAEIMNKPQQNLGGRTQKEALRLFFSELAEGETWQPKKLFAWSIDGISIGNNLHNIITPKIGFLNKKTIECIFGDEAQQIFTRNPFDGRERKINTIFHARQYLKEFMSYLDNGVEWTPTMIEE